MSKQHFSGIASNVKYVSSLLTSYWRAIQIIWITFSRETDVISAFRYCPAFPSLVPAHSQNFCFLSILAVALIFCLLFFLWIFFYVGHSQWLMCYHTDYGIFTEFKFFKAFNYWVALQGKLPLALLSVSFIQKRILAHVQAHMFYFSFIWCHFLTLFTFLLPAPLLYFSVCIWFMLSPLPKLFGPILILVMEIYCTMME